MGDEIRLPDWGARKDSPRIAAGQPADLLLLRPVGDAGAYRVERVFHADGK